MTPEQEALLARVEGLLHESGARFERRLHGDALEPWVELHLLLPVERGLDAHVVVAPDVFALLANQAQLRLERVDFGDDGERWSEECLQTLETLLRSELRIRVRRKLTGGSAGAIRVPREGHRDAWNGDLLATVGLGTEQVFRDWWLPPEPEE